MDLLGFLSKNSKNRAIGEKDRIITGLLTKKIKRSLKVQAQDFSFVSTVQKQVRMYPEVEAYAVGHCVFRYKGKVERFQSIRAPVTYEKFNKIKKSKSDLVIIIEEDLAKSYYFPTHWGIIDKAVISIGKKDYNKIKEGFEIDYHVRKIKADCQNIIAEKEGTDGRPILLIAHYDAAPFSKGINDDASGVFVLFKLIEKLEKIKTRHKIIFCLTSAEESGVVGAKHLAKYLQREDIFLVVSLECLISKETLAYTANIDQKIFAALSTFKKRKNIVSCDYLPFAAQNIPSICFAGNKNRLNHTKREKLTKDMDLQLSRNADKILKFLILIDNENPIKNKGCSKRELQKYDKNWNLKKYIKEPNFR